MATIQVLSAVESSDASQLAQALGAHEIYAYAPVDVEIVENDLKTDRLMFGQGFNAITGQQGGVPVKYEGPDDIAPVVASKGQEVEFRLEQITSLEQFHSMFSGSAAASLGLGVFKAGAAAQFFASKILNSYSVYVYVDVVVKNPAVVLKRAVFTPEAQAVIQKGPEAFLSYAGNCYVYGIRTGGRFTAIAEYLARTEEEYQKTAATVSASISGFNSAKTSAQFESSVASLSKLNQYKIHVLRSGGAGEVPTLEELSNVARRFPLEVAAGTNDVIISTYTRGYNTVEGYPAGFLDANQHNRWANNLEAVTRKMAKCYQARNNALYVRQHPDQFDMTPELSAQLDRFLVDIEDLINQLWEAAQFIRSNPDANAPADISVPVFQPPRKKKPEPAPLRIFEHNEFAGRVLEVRESIPNLHEHHFGDLMSSFHLEGKPGQYTAEFFAHPNYSERIFAVQSPYRASVPFTYPGGKVKIDRGYPSHGIVGIVAAWNDQISSIRLTKHFE